MRNRNRASYSRNIIFSIFQVDERSFFLKVLYTKSYYLHYNKVYLWYFPISWRNITIKFNMDYLYSCTIVWRNIAQIQEQNIVRNRFISVQVTFLFDFLGWECWVDVIIHALLNNRLWVLFGIHSSMYNTRWFMCFRKRIFFRDVNLVTLLLKKKMYTPDSMWLKFHFLYFADQHYWVQYGLVCTLFFGITNRKK
jgi:hypothetical protein